jgi:2-(1,2-epoxy-1,2-dihydrophenyl)acetyl-CoA isomerase
MEENTVLVEMREIAPHARYHVVTLNRPQKLNAFVGPLVRDLAAAFDAAGRDAACRAVLLTGAGIVCAVNGVAAGAGANLALACDIVLAARSASFIQAFARIGLMPDLGGTFFLSRLAGSARARGLAMLAEPLEAERAEDWGLIWKAVDDGALMDEAHALCARFCAAPHAALAAIKRAIDAAAADSLDQQLDLERDLQGELGRTPDFAEGVRAFLGKRPAAFGPRGAD